MFKIAQQIVRHKVGVVAVLAFAAFVFTRDAGEEEAAKKAANPWSTEHVAAASTSKSDSMIGKAVDVAGGYIEETTGVNPVEMTDETVNRFDKTNEAYAKANGGR